MGVGAQCGIERNEKLGRRKVLDLGPTFVRKERFSDRTLVLQMPARTYARQARRVARDGFVLVAAAGIGGAALQSAGLPA
jgi:hypothetical protein